MKCESLPGQSVDEASTSRKFLVLTIIGFLMFFVGVSILVVATVLSDGNLGVGGFILIGPIPIVFGAGPQAAWMILFATVITILSVITFLALRRKTRKADA